LYEQHAQVPVATLGDAPENGSVSGRHLLWDEAEPSREIPAFRECCAANWPKHGFGGWLVRAAQRLHPNVLAAALANKLARIAWTVLAQARSYETRVTQAAA
jgi:hypothetical protein